ncbi:MAG: 1,2-phenylacetyl-CoA epoxidase subunit PaaD [Lapillicoccus sp.]
MTTTAQRLDPVDLKAALAEIPDPEVPVISIAELGILRSVVADPDTGVVDVVITPTYSGCPAMEAISDHVTHVCRRAGWEPRVTTRLSPAWTTDWMTDAGRERLREFGIAPPTHTPQGGPVTVSLTLRVVTCPRCGSEDTTELARFGSTACKALRRCEVCREPFDEFKTL